MLYQALSYPLQGKGSFRRVLILALLQLIPIVGQLILLGYGLDIVRAVSRQQTTLPPIDWRSTVLNGLRMLLAGFGYLLPILLTIGLIGASGTSGNSGIVGIIGILVAVGLPFILVVVGVVAKRRTAEPVAQRPDVRRNGPRPIMVGLLSMLLAVLGILALRMLIAFSGIDTGKPNVVGILLFVLLALFLFLLGVVFGIGGVRYALENKGLLAPAANLQIMLKRPALTAVLVLNILLLGSFAIIVTTVGLVLFILPGLLAFVVCSLAFWQMSAQYALRSWLHTPTSSPLREVESKTYPLFTK